MLLILLPKLILVHFDNNVKEADEYLILITTENDRIECTKPSGRTRGEADELAAAQRAEAEQDRHRQQPDVLAAAREVLREGPGSGVRAGRGEAAAPGPRAGPEALVPKDTSE